MTRFRAPKRNAATFIFLLTLALAVLGGAASRAASAQGVSRAEPAGKPAAQTTARSTTAVRKSTTAARRTVSQRTMRRHPKPPTALAAGTRTTSSVAVTWTASQSRTVTSYRLYRDNASTGTTSGTSYTFTGLACGTTYHLSVDAADLLGNRSSKASIDTATAACPDTQAPTAPGALAATAATRTSIAISWTASTDNAGVTGYTVYKNGSSVTTTTGTSYTFAGLTCGTSYTLAVDASDAKGNRSAKTSAMLSTSPCPDTTAPTAPPNVTVVGTSGNSITLAWTSSLDDTAVAAYGLYRNGSSAGSTPGTSYTFTGLTCGTSYSLAVDAVDDAGNRSAKSTAGASTSACPGDTSAPTVPTGLRVGTTGATTIAVSWTASTDNKGVAGYGAYNGTTLAGTTASTSYTFTGLACGKSYTLAVDAYDAAGNRSGKATVNGSTTACSDTTAPSTPTGLTVGTTSSSTIAISWTASTDNVGVTGYGAYNGANLAGSPTSTSYTFNGLTCGTSYTLAVDAVDGAGNRSGKATVNGSTTACPPPGGGGATSGNANLWVDTNGGSCTRQAAGGSYVDSQACGIVQQRLRRGLARRHDLHQGRHVHGVPGHRVPLDRHDAGPPAGGAERERHPRQRHDHPHPRPDLRGWRHGRRQRAEPDLGLRLELRGVRGRLRSRKQLSEREGQRRRGRPHPRRLLR